MTVGSVVRRVALAVGAVQGATMLTLVAVDLYRKRGREVQDSEGTYAERMATHGNQESHLDLEDFRKALAKLPEEQREVLIMVGATGLSYEETAEICGVAVGTIKSRVARGRVALENLMSGSDMTSRTDHTVVGTKATLDEIMDEVDELSRDR